MTTPASSPGPAPVPCPDCRTPLPPGRPGACPACGLPLTGLAAAELWDVDTQLDALWARREALLARLRSGSATPAAVAAAGGAQATQAAQAAPPAPPPVGPPVVAPVAEERSRLTAQQVLLAAGVLLLAVAALVFVGVVWRRIGVLGQSAVLLGVAAAAAAGARASAGRGLRASAEALAVLAVVLLAVTLQGAQRLGLFGLDDLSDATWLAGSAALVALVAVALDEWAAPRGRPGPLAHPVLALLAGAVVPSAVVDAADGGALAWPTTALAAAALTVPGVLALPVATARDRVVTTLAGVLVAAHAGIALLWLGGLVLDGQDGADARWTAALLLAVAALAAVLHRWAARTTGAAGAAPRRPAVATTAAVTGWTALGGAVLALADPAGAGALLGTAAALGVGIAVLAVVTGGLLAPARRGRRAPVGLLPTLGATAGVALVLEAERSFLALTAPPPAVRGGAWLALAVGAGAAAATARGGRAAWAGAAGFALVVAALAGGADLEPAGQVALAAAAGLALLALAAWRRGRAEEAALLPCATLGWLGAVVLALLDGDAPVTSAALGAAGLATMAYAGLRGRGAASAPAVLLLAAATWVLSADAGLESVEPYSLPLAALALAVGLVRRRRQPGTPSWLTVGPGLSAALLPSAVASVDDDGLLRPLLTLTAAVVVVVAGVLLAWQAPVVTGSVAAVVVAVSQLAPYAVGLPRWLSLGAAGVVLLALGVRFERRRRDVVAAAGWVRSLG